MEKRFLNKIVFIHSANIPFEEVELDGHIHLTGNQGTGKTSILRAIQFFYTADKTKLGINSTDPGKKSFEEFYFPHNYSYIVYEVNGSAGIYSILALRVQGRICYHFIDAPFSKDWLFEGGRTLTDWYEIRSRIGAECSARILTKEQYKDIIYGNFSKVDRSLHKYALMSSKKYHQLPIILQNVFLNAGLKADQIKDTIVESVLNGESGDVVLDDYRDELKQFESEYQDIMLWYKEQSDGHIEVRDLAESIRENYTQYKEYEAIIRKAYAELIYANQSVMKQIPLLEAETKGADEAYSASKKLLEDAKREYAENERKLSELIGAKKEWLETCRKKHDEIDSLSPSIDEILRRSAAKESIEANIAECKQRKDEFLKQHESIRVKYKALEKNEKQGFERALLDIERQRTEARSRHQQQLEPLHAQQKEADKKAFDAYQRALENIQKQTAEANEELSRRMQLKAAHAQECPFKQKLDDLNKRLETQKKELNGQSAQLQKNEERIASLKKNLEAELKLLQAGHDQEQMPVNQRLEDGEKRRDILAGKLSSIQDSLLAWLDEHPALDAEAIKKVVDQDLLLRTDMSPRMADSPAESVYGLYLNLDSIKRTPLSAETLQNELRDIESEIATKKKQLHEGNKILEEAKAALEEEARSNIRSLNEQNRELSISIGQLPTLIVLTEDSLAQTREEENAWHKEQELVDNNSIEEQKTFIQDLSKSSKLEADRYSKATDKNKEQFDKDKQRFDDELNEAMASLDALQKEQEANHQKIVEELAAAMRTELEGKGLDTSFISEIDNQICALEQEQKFISNHAGNLAKYLLYKEEYFNKEDVARNEKSRLEQERKNLKEAEDFKEADINSQINERYQAWKMKKDSLAEANTDAEEFRDFSLRPGFSSYADLAPYPTTDRCTVIIKRIQSSYESFRNYDSQLKDAVRTFAGKFSKGNVFKFETSFETDAQMRAFAVKLVEFLDQNALDTYQTLLSGLYQRILVGLSHEVDNWRSRRADIERLVNDLNADFASKGFAGVIKEIRLKVDDTDNRLVNLLYKIDDYARENEFNFDSYNLFNSDARKTEKVVYQSVQYLQEFNRLLNENSDKAIVSIADTFVIQFRVRENNNDTGWQTRLHGVGSDGTDVLVKSIINIMLVSVFRKRVVGKAENFKLHCMMDEIGRLHTDNIIGLIQFANEHDIWIVNGSPSNTEPQCYRHTYLAVKDVDSRTHLRNFISQRTK